MSVCVVRVLTCNLKAPTASSAPSPASRIPEIESWRRRRRDDGAFPLPLTGSRIAGALGHLLPPGALQLHGQPGGCHGGGKDLRGALRHPRPKAASPLAGLLLRHRVGEQRRGVHQEELPRDA